MSMVLDLLADGLNPQQIIACRSSDFFEGSSSCTAYGAAMSHERFVAVAWNPLLDGLLLDQDLCSRVPASTHVAVEFCQREGNSGFVEIEDGIRSGEGFPPEACACPRPPQRSHPIRRPRNCYFVR